MNIEIAIWMGSVGIIFGCVAMAFTNPKRKIYKQPKGYWDHNGDLGKGRRGSKWVEDK